MLYFIKTITGKSWPAPPLETEPSIIKWAPSGSPPKMYIPQVP